MAGDTGFIGAHKYCIVIFGIFVEKFPPDKVGYHISGNVPVLHQIGVDPAHIGVERGQGKGLGWCLCRFGCTGVHLIQKHGDRLRVSTIVKKADETDGIATLATVMVKPLATTNGDAVVRGQTFVPTGGEQFLASLPEKIFQVHGGSPFLLFFCEVNIG